MKRQTIITGVLTIIMIVIWNSMLFLDWSKTSSPFLPAWQNSAGDVLNTVNTSEPQLWQDIKKTVVKQSPDTGFDPQFDPAVISIEGTQVELPGVGFLLSSGLGENAEGEEEVSEFLLLPSYGGVAWCCGLSPIAKHEFSVLVDCHDHPFPASKVDPRSPAFFVNVKGTLQLEQENTLNALYTLEDVTIDFVDIEEILPPNVKNLCLDRPMDPRDLKGPRPTEAPQPNSQVGESP
ncbi:MAG: hypothetical protein AAFU85_24750 [Planctomycetota bacterium]